MSTDEELKRLNERTALLSETVMDGMKELEARGEGIDKVRIVSMRLEMLIYDLLGSPKDSLDRAKFEEDFYRSLKNVVSVKLSIGKDEEPQ